MEEQDYKNLISIYQKKVFDFINQNIASEARELKFRQQVEVLTDQVNELNTRLEKLTNKPKRVSKTSGGEV